MKSDRLSKVLEGGHKIHHFLDTSDLLQDYKYLTPSSTDFRCNISNNLINQQINSLSFLLNKICLEFIFEKSSTIVGRPTASVAYAYVKQNPPESVANVLESFMRKH